MFSVSLCSMKKSLYTLTLFSICTLFASTLFAWPTVNGVPVCAATDDQQNPVISSDSAGGYFIAWQDWRNGVDQNIYAQHINSQGSTLWTPDGLAICTANGDQTNPAIVSDGSGGAIISWQDGRSGHNNDPGIYAQRINSQGSTLWRSNGAVVSTTYNGVPGIISDGSGGSLMTISYDGGAFGSYCYMHHVNSQGSTLWAKLAYSGSFQNGPSITTDGAGGSILGWRDGAGYTIRVQRINSTGSTVWSPTGSILSTLGFSPYITSIVSDTSGGAFILWTNNGANNHIFCQRVNSQSSSLWTTNGIDICSTGISPQYPKIVSDVSGNAIITWQDYTNATSYGGGYIRALGINSDGSTLWTNNISTAGYNEINPFYNPLLLNDGAGGAIITWTDYRSTTGNPGQGAEIYSQRVNSNGSTLWTANGVAVCTSIGDQTVPLMVSNGSGGVVITWHDHRGSDWDIYAQSVYSTGLLPVEDWGRYGRNSSKVLRKLDW